MARARRRVVMITGAAGNLGRAVAKAFAEDGARLALVDLSRARIEKSCGRETRDRLPLAVDILKATTVEKAAATIEARFGRIDVLCNVAGGFHMGEPVHELPDAAWQRMLDLNARSVLNTARAVVPRMLARGGGKIVNVGAQAASQGRANMGAYVVAKSAVMRLTETMAAELRGQGINVNCVLPSIIDTPENRAAMPKADPAKWVSPEKLAAVVRFLASSDADPVHGACLPVVGLS